MKFERQGTSCCFVSFGSFSNLLSVCKPKFGDIYGKFNFVALLFASRPSRRKMLVATGVCNAPDELAQTHLPLTGICPHNGRRCEFSMLKP